MSSSCVVALDLGASRAVLGVLTRGRDGRLVLRDFAVHPLAADPGQNDADWMGRIGAVCAKLVQGLAPDTVCVLTVPGHLTVAKLISTPVMASAKRRKIIRFEAQQSFPNELDELVWSHATVAVRDGEILSLVAAAKCGDMEAVCAGVGSAGFVPRQVVPSVTALIRAFHTTIPRSRSGCCSSASERARRICS